MRRRRHLLAYAHHEHLFQRIARVGDGSPSQILALVQLKYERQNARQAREVASPAPRPPSLAVIHPGHGVVHGVAVLGIVRGHPAGR